jgi:hypothetical protein
MLTGCYRSPESPALVREGVREDGNKHAGLFQQIREKARNRLALVGTIAAVARVQVAALFKVIELGLRHDDRPHEEATFAALAVPGIPIHC